MNNKLRKFVSGAAAAITAAAMMGIPVSAASAETQRYIAANNRALIEVGASPISYAEGISRYYYGKYFTSRTASETIYTDNTYSTPVQRQDWDGNDLTTETYQLEWEYDDAGYVTYERSTNLYSSDGTSYTYDANHQLVRSSEASLGDEDGESIPYVTNYTNTYNADGVLLQRVAVAGFGFDGSEDPYTTVTTYSYDKYGRISEINSVSTPSDDPEYTETSTDHFTYKNNRLVRIYGSYGGADAESNWDYHLNYDESKRLVSAVDTGYPGILYSYQFAYGEGNALAAIMEIDTPTDENNQPMNTDITVTQYSFGY